MFVTNIIYDCLSGDATLFQRADNIEAWATVDPVLQGWAATGSAPELYKAGSTEPKGPEDLVKRDGREWGSIAED